MIGCYYYNIILNALLLILYSSISSYCTATINIFIIATTNASSYYEQVERTTHRKKTIYDDHHSISYEHLYMTNFYVKLISRVFEMINIMQSPFAATCPDSSFVRWISENNKSLSSYIIKRVSFVILTWERNNIFYCGILSNPSTNSSKRQSSSVIILNNRLYHFFRLFFF